MDNLDIPQKIKDLEISGLSQKEIGKRLDIAQSTVSDLKSGRLKSVRFGVGIKLLALHSELKNPLASETATPP